MCYIIFEDTALWRCYLLAPAGFAKANPLLFAYSGFYLGYNVLNY
jgi:hypothetical protein